MVQSIRRSREVETPVAQRLRDLCCSCYKNEICIDSSSYADWQMTARLDSTIDALRQARETMTQMSYQHPVYTNEISDIVHLSKKATQAMMFMVRRYYDVKEEAIRFKYQQQLAALNQEHNALFSHWKKRATLSIKQSVESRVAMNSSQCHKRLRKLQYALDKVVVYNAFLSFENVSDTSS